MNLFSYLRSLVFGPSSGDSKRRPGRSRLSFENLEARELLAGSILSPADCGITIAGKSQFVLGYFMSIAPAPGSSCTAASTGELPASISGCVYADLNNDGFMEPGEAGIGNVTITLSGVDDMGNQIVVPILTAADGTYGFGNLRPGTYTLTESQPAGYLDGKDTLGSAGGTALNDQFALITLGPGTNAVNYKFGELPAASLSGCVYVDANDNGVMDPGEKGIPGTTISLTGTDDLGQPVHFMQNTAADGTYSFGHLRPGSYTITETQPSGYFDGKDSLGSAGGNLGNDTFSDILLTPGQSGINYKFGELQGTLISGSVYVDLNDNGIMEGGEPGIAGVTIMLSGTDNTGNAVNQTQTTAADGSFTFGGLHPGTYTLSETQPLGYLDGKDSVGSAGGTLANDQISAISLVSGTPGTNYKFGELLPASLKGFVYVDNNNDGVMQANEPGIPGTTIALTGTDLDGGTVSLSQTTAADGSFAFTNLRPGTYTVNETQPAGYLDGKDSAGSAGGQVANDQISAIQLGVGVDAVNYKFGEIPPARINGFVYVDTNNDGIMEANDPGIANVVVTLTGTDVNGQSVNRATSTASDGSYGFSNLLPGTYTVTETQPGAFLDGKDSVGSLGGTAGNDVFSNIVLPVGVTGINYKFGELMPAVIKGFVYVDNMDTGVRDKSDPGIANVLITLSGTDDLDNAVTQTQTTAADGSYAFVNLRPGTYAVQETQPANYLDGKDTIGAVAGKTTNDRFDSIALAAGVVDPDNNFGELVPASVGGCVYIDANGNGVMDPGELPIPGVTITLTGTDDLGNTVNVVQTTDANRQYNFANLRPGTYTITETQPAGFLQGQNSIGNLGGTKANDQFFIGVASGNVGLNYKFGEVLPVPPVIGASSSNDTGGKGQFLL
jgi:uncharacterized protein (DUF2141 family)